MESSIYIYDIGGTAEVAKVLGCPKQQIYALRRRSDFPKPFLMLASTPLWDLKEIKLFASTWKRRSPNTTMDDGSVE